MKEITESMKNLMIRSDAGHTENNDGREMIKQLKDKFEVTTDRATQKIQDEFSVTNYMACKSKELVKEKGVLSIPNPKPGPSLSPETTDLIIRFYESDEISRVLPGKKDYVSVKKEGKRVHVQKRLVLCDLKEAYMISFQLTKYRILEIRRVASQALCACRCKWDAHRVCLHDSSKC